MGFDPVSLPPHVLRLMSEEDRRKLGKGSQLPEETIEKGEKRAEKYLHRDIERYCDLHGWVYFTSRMDKRTSRARGEPDFICLLPEGTVLFVEAKTPRGTLSFPQEEMKRKMESLGHKVHVVRSLEQFIALT